MNDMSAYTFVLKLIGTVSVVGGLLTFVSTLDTTEYRDGFVGLAFVLFGLLLRIEASVIRLSERRASDDS
ncbi:MAG: hypothetical protein HOV77_17155 [Hamadaea sp.]|uniref:hypothetical protein n=1 Tax=Hamadaea sp. TaxID=2024425 RepID=UPI001826F7C1|nr:hypothetical protein [Hamadaea sp.]NUT20910.1 hypothetical protein [Hamadaea sp.]